MHLSHIGSVADPGSSTFLTPGSGMGKKSGSGSGMNNPDHISESLECNKCNKFRSGIGDKHPGSATLPIGLYYIRSDIAYCI
jgi:hypothetical protein